VVIPSVFHRSGNASSIFAGAWKGACSRAGLPGRFVHDFRRTAARNSAEHDARRDSAERRDEDWRLEDR
jgi:hypothetical protein